MEEPIEFRHHLLEMAFRHYSHLPNRQMQFMRDANAIAHAEDSRAGNVSEEARPARPQEKGMVSKFQHALIRLAFAFGMHFVEEKIDGEDGNDNTSTAVEGNTEEGDENESESESDVADGTDDETGDTADSEEEEPQLLYIRPLRTGEHTPIAAIHIGLTLRPARSHLIREGHYVITREGRLAPVRVFVRLGP